MDIKIKIRHTGVRILITVLLIALFRFFFTVSNAFAEFYFHRLYIWISSLLRQVLGKVPFSVGDVIYAAWVIGGTFYLLKFCYILIKGRWWRLLYMILKAVSFLLTVYFVFLLFWGYNYDRQSLEEDMQLNVKPYETEQLYKLTDTLLTQVNSARVAMGDTIHETHPGADSAQLFKRAITAYQEAEQRWPVLRYRFPSVKPSLYAKWLNYPGIGGYLNPFTGEAQVNTTTPGFEHPFTICHEMAHQLGYAAEQEANFVGYLVADHSSDPRFRYAANYEMFMYSIRQLGRRDTTLAGQLWRRAVPGIKADHEQMIRFYERYTGGVDAYTTMLYDQYLKANKQEKGIRSYSEVVGWLIAYFKIE
jgi:hypothetical protein